MDRQTQILDLLRDQMRIFHLPPNPIQFHPLATCFVDPEVQNYLSCARTKKTVGRLQQTNRVRHGVSGSGGRAQAMVERSVEALAEEWATPSAQEVAVAVAVGLAVGVVIVLEAVGPVAASWEQAETVPQMGADEWMAGPPDGLGRGRAMVGVGAKSLRVTVEAGGLALVVNTAFAVVAVVADEVKEARGSERRELEPRKRPAPKPAGLRDRLAGGG